MSIYQTVLTNGTVSTLSNLDYNVWTQPYVVYTSFAQPSFVYSDSAGLLQFTVPQGAWFLVQCAAIGLDHYGTAPLATTADLSTISLRPRLSDLETTDLERLPVNLDVPYAWGTLR